MLYNNNIISFRNGRSLIMYVDMNSYFASCEQQLQKHLRGKPIRVCPYLGDNAVVIAASKEAKAYGITTGMKYAACLQLCPSFIMVPTRPFLYRKIHVAIMKILNSYCKEVLPKSIDEAVVNLTHYMYIYKDVMALAKQIKRDIAATVGEYITCSIGIAGNVFLAKLATEIQKPDGLIYITPENIDAYLSKLQLIDLPGIGNANQKRLYQAGIYTPLDLRYASESLLRKAFGGVVGNYWHYRLNFKEVDLHLSDYKHMSAMRSLSAATRNSREALQSMFISLCTRLEQRMVKQNVFCRQISFYASYYDAPEWKTTINLDGAVQDAMDIVQYLQKKIGDYEVMAQAKPVIRKSMSGMGVMVGNFIAAGSLQYSLFDKRLQQDMLRKTLYDIKDKYGKNMVRKACETIQPGQMKDAIGFGSVKDMYMGDLDIKFNNLLLEDDPEMAGVRD